MPRTQSAIATTTTRAHRRDRSAVLITGAPRSPAEEFAARRRRYSLIMGMRIPCLVLAGVFGIGFGMTGLAAVLVVASVPLPWIAVLIANDAPPRRSEKVARDTRDHTRTVGTTAPLVLDAPVVIDLPVDATATTPVHPGGSR